MVYLPQTWIVISYNWIWSLPLSSKIHKMFCPIFRVVISSITISHINNNCRSVWWMSSWHLINMEEILSWRRNNFQVILSWNKLRKSWLYFPTDLLKHFMNFTRKGKRKEVLSKYNKARINIGHQYGCWLS
jgi:hypothetical protein